MTNDTMEGRFSNFRNDGEHCSIGDGFLNHFDVEMIQEFIRSECDRAKRSVMEEIYYGLKVEVMGDDDIGTNIRILFKNAIEQYAKSKGIDITSTNDREV